MNANGSGINNVTNNSLDENHPAWSPDGKKIAFSTSECDAGTINPDGTGRATLGLSLCGTKLDWQPIVSESHGDGHRGKPCRFERGHGASAALRSTTGESTAMGMGSAGRGGEVDTGTTGPYRALISIPIADELRPGGQGEMQAASLRHPDGATIAGHVELVGEVRADLMELGRVCHADPLFLRKLPQP